MTLELSEAVGLAIGTGVVQGLVTYVSMRVDIALAKQIAADAKTVAGVAMARLDAHIERGHN